MNGNYFKPNDLEEAARLLSENPDALFIAGGTWLFASKPELRKDMTFISVGAILPRGLSLEGDRFTLGAGTTFQEILESPLAPPALKAAAASMATRNIRNRATVGGNLGVDKSCSSLMPFFLVSETQLLCTDGVERSIEQWRASRSSLARLILSVSWDAPTGRSFACAKYSRTASDLAILTCAVSAELRDGRLGCLRIAAGGLASHAERFPALEGALERALETFSPCDKAAVEAIAEPQFHPIDDLRGSAAFKRKRAAVLLADVLTDVFAQLLTAQEAQS